MYKKYVKYIGIIGVFLCVGVLLYQDIFGIHDEKREGGDNNILFILDVSQSMNVADMSGKSRLSAAKNYIKDIVTNVSGYEYALSIFAGDSQRVLPFTTQSNTFITLLAGLDSRNILEQGTNIEVGISESLASFGEDRSGYIVILSDGDEAKIDMSSDTQKLLKEANIGVYIVGFGTEQGGLIPTGDRFQPYKIYNGQRVIVGLNEAGLQTLADTLDGEYVSYLDEIPDFTVGDGNSQGIYDNTILLVSLLIFWVLYTGFLICESYNFSRKK